MSFFRVYYIMLNILKIKRLIFSNCEFQRECRKDYWTYNEYARVLESIAFELRRRTEAVKEEIKHDKT